MDSQHARQINRPRLLAKGFSGDASTERAIRMLRKNPLHEFRRPLPPRCSEVSQEAKTIDHSEEETLPPLHYSSDIRLITVLPDLREGLPQCLVSIHSIDEPFITLSYTWGPAANNHTIWLNDVRIHIRCHLWQFLLMASHNFPNVLIWIDALCIDQLNTSERSEQVRRMGVIYAAFTKTLTFLAGTECATSDARPGTTQDIHQLRDLDRDVQKCLQALKAIEETRHKGNEPFSPWDEAFDEQSLLSVLNIVLIIAYNAYWARLWVIQENILSGASNTIIVNDAIVSFTKLSSLTTYICNTYKDSMRMQSKKELHIRDRVPVDFDEYQPPASQDVLHRESDNLPNTIDEWIAEILDCTTDPTRNGLITADFLPLALSPSPELDRYEFLQLMQRVQTSLCSDRRDKIYGLRSFQKVGDRFPVDYSEDVYGLYFRACRYFQGVIQEKQHTFADNQTPTTQAVSASLDLGILDLVFGDDSERTVLATMERKDSTSEHVTYLDTTGSRLPADVHTDIFILCKHCQRCVTIEREDNGELLRCVVQCHQQLHVLKEIKDDHYVIQIEDTEDNCRVKTATSWVDPNDCAVNTTSFAVNDRMRLSLDQVSWLVYLDELFRRRPYHYHTSSLLVESLRTEDTFEPPLRGFGTKPGLRSNGPGNPGWRREIRWFLLTDNLEKLGLEEKAEERLVQCLHTSQLSLRQNTSGKQAISEWSHSFDESAYGYFDLNPHYHMGDSIYEFRSVHRDQCSHTGILERRKRQNP